MSTIAVAKKDGYVSIGADTLTTYGSTKETVDLIANSTKIVKTGETYIATTGHASTDLILQDYFSGTDAVDLTSRASIFSFSLDLHRALKERYFLNPEEHDDDEYESIQMRCLLANPSGIFGLYQLRSVQEYTKYYAMGAGYPFALGAMHAVYDRMESAEDIVRTGLGAAEAFNDATAEPLEIYTIKLEN